MLVWRKGTNNNCLCATVLCTIIMVQAVLQVGRLYRALILLGLALGRPSASVSLIFIVLHT